MPWTIANVEKHKKGLTKKQKGVWVEVANNHLAKCLEAGDSDEVCSGQAIRIANTAAAKVKEGIVDQEVQDMVEGTEGLKEAITIKAQILGILKQAEALMAIKHLPAVMRDHIKTMKTNLKKSWAELAMDGEPEDEPANEAEALEIAGDFIALVEGLKGDGDKVRLKVIQPGWGASGFYPSEVLERDAGVYEIGTKMFWDHPTLSEEKDRPERSLRDLAGVLVSAGKWDAGGSAGPGIYADAQVFGNYKGIVTELSPHIGVSHRAMGKARKGEVEGQKGNIIEQITVAQSVDFVTSPGAGGQILQLFEAAKGQQQVASIERKEVIPTMTEEEIKALETKVETLEREKGVVETENARLKEVMLLAEAGAFVVAELKETKLPDMTRQRLTESLGKNPPVVDGALDKETLKARIKEVVDSEIAYLAQVTTSGEIRGMGSVGVVETGALKDAFVPIFANGGHSPEESQRLAEIAAAGR